MPARDCLDVVTAGPRTEALLEAVGQPQAEACSQLSAICIDIIVAPQRLLDRDFPKGPFH